MLQESTPKLGPLSVTKRKRTNLSSDKIGRVKKEAECTTKTTSSVTDVQQKSRSATASKKKKMSPCAVRKRENTQKDFPASNLKITIKGKDPQAPQAGSVTSLVLSNVQPSSVNFPGSSVHPLTQRVDERPCKNLRPRRLNVISPVSRNDERPCKNLRPAFDFPQKDSSVVNSGYQLEARRDKSTQKYKRPADNTLRLGLSESEEFGAVGNKLTEKGMNNSEFVVSAKKNGHSNSQIRKKTISTDEFGDCVPRKGRTARPSLTRRGLPSGRVKSENQPILKPAENKRPADNSKMKYGCPPPKKQKGCKVSTHAGQMQNNASSDLHESGTFVNPACSGPFWEKAEASFATISEENASFLKQQMALAEELDKTLSQIISLDHVMDNIMNNEATHSSEERQRGCCGRKGAENNTLTEKCNGENLDNATPLFKLLCSAIISEDESEELSPLNEATTISQKCGSDDFPRASYNQFDFEPGYLDKTDFEVESEIILQIQNWPLDKLSCNKSIASSPLCGGSFPTDDEYQRMSLDEKLLLELHSIGLYPEILPTLAEEDEAKNQNIVTPEEKLSQQIGRKENFDTTDTSIEKRRDPERQKIVQVVFDQLIEMTHGKILACLGSKDSKGDGIKVSKQVALGFVKRALGSCKIDEETGNSCFSEPDLRHIILSTHSCQNVEKSDACTASGLANNTCNKPSDLEEASKPGAVSGAPEKFDSHMNDIVVTGVGGGCTTTMNLNGLVNFQVKRKRSRRDRNGSKDKHKTDGGNNNATSEGKQSTELGSLEKSLSGELDFLQHVELDTLLDGDDDKLLDIDFMVGLPIPPMDELSGFM